MLAYKELKRIYLKQSILSDIDSILQWDLSTFMPQSSREQRVKQLCLLSDLKHNLFSSPEVKNLFEKANLEKLDLCDKANLREMNREYKYLSAFSSKFIEKKTRLTSICEGKWREAREKKKFGIVSSDFRKLIEIIKEEAKILSELFNCSEYDALMKNYNYSFDTEEIKIIFEDLRQFINQTYPKVIEKQKSEDELRNLPNLTENQQLEISKFFMKKFGFRFQMGRIDKSLHPFCGGATDDVRITTRFSKNNPFSSFEAVMHETGHALYEQGLPSKWKNQPLGKSGDMVLHESQSLFVEMQILKSRAFLEYFSKTLNNKFRITEKAVQPDSLFKHFNIVKKSYIRVDADEITYPLHVLLRFDLERRIIRNDFDVKYLPDVWNESFEKIFGFKVDNDANGCLQDIHWFAGLFGYFPTYTLGAIISSQLKWAITNEVVDYDDCLKKGNFKEIIKWLRKRIHSKGRLMLTKELLKETTDKSISTKFFKDHINNKFLKNKNKGRNDITNINKLD